MEKNKKILVGMVAVLTVVAVVCVSVIAIFRHDEEKFTARKIDDWKYNGEAKGGKYRNVLNSSIKGGNMAMTAESAADSTLGFSVGGAKDIENFRENIENGYFPIFTDITYNGLFYDYMFDTGIAENTGDLFSPSYSTAISKDPFSNKEEYYMTVGLNSNIKESDFKRKKLNIVVMLDISGSMSSSLNDYYYDDPFNKNEEVKSKMLAASESVNILLDQLNDDDRFGMVLFSTDAYLAKELNLIGVTDIEKIKNHILEIEASGGTNFEAGYKKSTKLFEDIKDVDSDEYENRIIVITDAMPNYGMTNEEDLLGLVNKNSENKIYTTFIGVGVDFNTKLIETISDVKGTNYYSVHTVEEFKSRMGEQFDYMVTPLVFDLKLDVESEDYVIEAIYGTDNANKETGNIMNVNTLFPSKSVDGEVKGGVVLLKLKKTSENSDGTLKINVSYKDRNGEKHSNYQEVKFVDGGEETYDNTGIRKAIVLTRYVNLMKDWILYERTEEPRFLIIPDYGIFDYESKCIELFEIPLGELERASVKLTVSDEYKKILNSFKTYMLAEIDELGDENMNQEIKIIEKLLEV